MLVVPVLIFFYLIRKHLLMGMTFGVLGKVRNTDMAVTPHATRQAALRSALRTG